MVTSNHRAIFPMVCTLVSQCASFSIVRAMLAQYVVLCIFDVVHNVLGQSFKPKPDLLDPQDTCYRASYG